MNAYGVSQGMAADLDLRERLNQAAERRTAADHAIEGLRIIAGHAQRWLDGTPAQSDPTAAMRTIRCIAEDGADRATAMQDEERTRSRGR